MTSTRPRPDFIRHWSDIEDRKPHLHPHTREPMTRGASFSRHFDLRRVAIRHDTLLPGCRSSQPHAERDEEEMVFILEGTPDLWVDGRVYRMKPDDVAGWPGRDGQAHCLINNTDSPVRMLTIAEASRYNSQVHFPLTRALDPWLDKQGKRWADPPARKLGPHDGLPDKMRGRLMPSSWRTTRKPACMVDWTTSVIEKAPYPGDDEVMGAWSRLTVPLGLTRVGASHDLLRPGRRSSWPHAEFDEEEFVFVVEGTPDAWIDGHLHRLAPGDGVGFPDRTGISHCFINNTQAPARLIVVGEASRSRSKGFYPLHPKRNREIGDGLWKDPPARKLGPHDGLSDARRAFLNTRRKRS
jgi:uncharacterized cupin superfamily protein